MKKNPTILDNLKLWNAKPYSKKALFKAIIR